MASSIAWDVGPLYAQRLQIGGNAYISVSACTASIPACAASLTDMLLVSTPISAANRAYFSGTTGAL